MTERQQAFRQLAPHLVDFSADDDGARTYAGRRFVFFHTTMFAELFEDMKDVAGPVIDTRISAFGQQAGHQIAAKLDAEFSDSSVLDILRLLAASGFDLSSLLKISDTDDHAQMEKIFGLGSFDGWVGDITVLEYEDGEQARFRAENTFESSSYGETGETECRFIPGVIGGILAYFWDTETSVTEEGCACTGADACQVLVTAAGAAAPDQT